MLDERYLVYGLDALSRAHQTNYFTDGHRGGAIISAYYFCHENDIEDGVADLIASIIDTHWTNSDLCVPFPNEKPDSSLIEKLTYDMAKSMDQLRQVGHNVILPALALKVFQQRPETITPSRIQGLCQLTNAFTIQEGIPQNPPDDLPDLSQPKTLAEFTLSELLQCIEKFDGRGQGWSGHLVTNAHALLDLRDAGYPNLSDQAELAFGQYIQRIRIGPLDTDKPRPEHKEINLRPHQRAYWERRQDKSVEIGHLFKYPYGFYGMIKHATDNNLKQNCMAESYHIF